jgi:hypothetical protein
MYTSVDSDVYVTHINDQRTETCWAMIDSFNQYNSMIFSVKIIYTSGSQNVLHGSQGSMTSSEGNRGCISVMATLKFTFFY